MINVILSTFFYFWIRRSLPFDILDILFVFAAPFNWAILNLHIGKFYFNRLSQYLILYKILDIFFFKGDDDLCVCKFINGISLGVQHYYNPSGYANPILMDNSSFINSNASLVNGALNCFIRRKKTPTTTRSNVLAATDNFDISNTPYNILFATGQLDSSSMNFLNIQF